MSMSQMQRVFAGIVVFVLLAGTLTAQSLQPAPANPAGSQQNSAPAPAAQQTASGQSPEMVLKVTTRMVVVDVVVRDKKDQGVPDLEAADFIVREDGVEQKISAFSFQRPGSTAVAAAASPAVALPPNVFRNVPHFRANSALNVILLDGLNTTLLNQAYVRWAMIKFLDKLPQGQPVAIYALGRKLRLLQDFTTDLSELKKVVQSFEGKPSHVLSNPAGTSEVPMTLQGWAEQTAIEKAPQFKSQIEGFAAETASTQTDTQIQYTMAALNSLARMLAGYPGRKNLIWITEGIPMNIFNEAGVSMASAQTTSGGPTRSLGNPDSQARSMRTYSDQLALINNLMADAQVAVYPVDARGLVGPAMSNVANNVSGQGAMGGLAQRMEGAQAEALFQAHSNMREIADKTGGKAFFNRNDLDNAVRGDMEDGSTYYTLGYYPQNKEWNGKFRKIQVATKRSGLKLRYRVGYYAVDRGLYLKGHPQQQMTELDLALSPDAPLASSVQFAVAVVPPTPTRNKVVLNYALDPHDISFAHGEDGLEHADLDCAARVFSAANIDKPVKSEMVRTTAVLKPDVYKTVSGSYFPCQLQFDLPPGSYLLRLVVRDNSTGLLGSVNGQVVIPPASSAADPKPAENSHQP
jgi:VWFA-related protein